MKEDKKYEHETKGWKKESGFHNPNNALLSLPDMRAHRQFSALWAVVSQDNQSE